MFFSMRFAVIYPLIALFIFFRLIWPAFKEKRSRAILCALVIPGALFPAVVRFVGGSMVAPDLPHAVMIAGGVLQNITFCVFVLTLFREAVSVPARIFGLPLGALGKSRMLACAIVALGTVAALYGARQAVDVLVVKKVDVEVDALDPRLEGLTIAQISDLHVSSAFRKERMERIVREVNALNPDMIAITGDFVDGEVKDRAGDLAPLKDLRAPLGVWGCEGNHEHYVDYDGWRRFLPSLGVKMLYNAHAVVEKNGASIVVAGLVDPMGGLRFGRELPNSAKAFEGAPQDVLRVLLLHQPKFAPRVGGKADLILSGHTHGAQIFVLDPIVEKLNQGFVKGLYNLSDGVKLYVSPGTDVWNGFLLRIGTAGEITLLTLKRAQTH